MRLVWISALKDLRRLRREPLTLAMWLGIPLFLAVAMSLIFGRGSVTPHGRLLVVDLDDTFLSGVVTGGFNQGPLAKMVTVEKVDAVEGRRRLDKGEASALLTIPKGFSTAFLDNRPAKLQLITNPSQRILPQIIEESLSILLDGGFYLQAVAGAELRLMNTTGKPTEEEVVSVSRSVNRLITRIQKYLDPLLIELETKVTSDEPKAARSFGAIFFPGMLFLALLFIAEGLAGDIWKEREAGTLRRFATTSAAIGAWAAGKTLAAGLVILAVAVLSLPVAGFLVGLPMTHAAPAVVWAALSGSALYLLLTLLVTLASSARVANLLGNLVMLPLAMIGGSFFPFEAMPSNLAAIGRLTPNGWMLTRFQAFLDGRVPVGEMMFHFGLLMALCTLTLWMITLRIRRRFLL